MRRKIENPKVFISYAWGSDAYQQKVLVFVNKLMDDGIQVVFDKFDLKEGNDTYAFMEQSVKDPSITNVLVLLDPVYADKANNKSGGVGTETQIISPNVYREVAQEKFLPVVMERDDQGNICKPIYLESRLHFDLSLEDEYDLTYQRLVKTLYGVEVYQKPVLGKKPDWVDKPIITNHKTIVRYDSLKQIQSEKLRRQTFRAYLREIQTKITSVSQDDFYTQNNMTDYILLYDATRESKEDFLQLMNSSVHLENAHRDVSEFFEDTINLLQKNERLKTDIKEVIKIRIHELYLYVIAYYLKNKDYQGVGYLLSKTYYNTNRYNDCCNADSFAMFYSGKFHNNLDNAIKKRDNKNYVTGTGQYWIETLNVDFCSKEEFLLADLICYNYSVYGKDYINRWKWFPVTYCYDNEFNSVLNVFAKKMVSREYIQEILPLFGYDTIEEFAVRIKEIEMDQSNDYRECRYSGLFAHASLLREYIKISDFASLR